MARTKCNGRGGGRKHAQNAYGQCVRMRKKMNQCLLPFMTKAVSALNTLNEGLEIVARQLKKYEESEDG